MYLRCKNQFMGPSLLLGCLVFSQAGLADTFSDNLTGNSLDSSFFIGGAEDAPTLYPLVAGYGAEFTQQGVVLSANVPNLQNGWIELSSQFTFSGNYNLTIAVSGLDSGLTGGAQAGLIVYGLGTGIQYAQSDIFGYGNSNIISNNWLGATMTDTHIGTDQDILTIAGNTNGFAYTLGFFLTNGIVSGNSVTYSNINLTADSIVAVTAVPLPPAFILSGSALAALGLLRKRKTG